MIGYHLLVIVVVVIAVWTGWHRGLARQTNSIIGFALGAVCAHVFAEPGEAFIISVMPWLESGWAASFIVSNLSAALIYCLVYILFSSLTTMVSRAFSFLGTGVLNSLFGAAFRTFNWLLFTSIALNVMICCNPESRLLKYAADEDGNIAGSTLLLAPAILGCDDAEDLAHLFQLREARKIS